MEAPTGTKMSGRVYRIKRGLLIALAVDNILLLILSLMAVVGEGPDIERSLLFIVFVPLLYMTLELFSRTVTIEETGFRLKKLLRQKDLDWMDVTHMGVLQVRKKVYLVLTTKKGFHIISNAYDHFSALVQDMLKHISPERTEEEVRTLVDRPVENRANMIAAWFTAALLVLVIYTKMVG
jgi:hypothetical protein